MMQQMYKIKDIFEKNKNRNSMTQNIMQVALVVDHYDEAIDFYINTLHFTLIEDTKLSDTKRWVVIAPPNSTGCRLLLAQAASDEQKKAVGNQTGGRVFLFLHTDDLQRDYENLRQHHVTIIREPSVEAFGKVLVFADLYGNLWDLIEPNRS